MRTKTILLGVIPILALAAAGCLFSPDEPEDTGGGGGGTNELPFPDTKEQLLTNFKEVYQLMDINLYGPMLHDDFKFFLQEADIREENLDFDHFNRDDDVDVMTQIFSGNAYVDDEGNTQQAITEITFPTLDVRTDWEASTHPDFPGAQRALYYVSIEFKRPDVTYIVTGLTEFFVISSLVEHNGVQTEYWQVMGQIDRTERNEKVLAHLD